MHKRFAPDLPAYVVFATGMGLGLTRMCRPWYGSCTEMAGQEPKTGLRRQARITPAVRSVFYSVAVLSLPTA